MAATYVEIGCPSEPLWDGSAQGVAGLSPGVYNTSSRGELLSVLGGIPEALRFFPCRCALPLGTNQVWGVVEMWEAMPGWNLGPRWCGGERDVSGTQLVSVARANMELGEGPDLGLYFNIIVHFRFFNRMKSMSTGYMFSEKWYHSHGREISFLGEQKTLATVVFGT